MKRVGVLFVMIFCVGFVMALEFDVVNFCSEEAIGDFELPGKVPFSNEVINVYLEEESIGHVVLVDKKIDSYGCGEHEKPTYNIFIEDDQVIQDMIDAEDVVGEYNKQRASGGLIIDAVGVWRNIKLFFINLLSRFF